MPSSSSASPAAYEQFFLRSVFRLERLHSPPLKELELTALAAQSRCCCLQQWYLQGATILGSTYHSATTSASHGVQVLRPCTSGSGAAPVAFVFGL